MCSESPLEIQELHSVQKERAWMSNRERRACTCLHMQDRVVGVVGTVTHLSRFTWGREMCAVTTVWVIPTCQSPGTVHHVRVYLILIVIHDVASFIRTGSCVMQLRSRVSVHLVWDSSAQNVWEDLRLRICPGTPLHTRKGCTAGLWWRWAWSREEGTGQGSLRA